MTNFEAVLSHAITSISELAAVIRAELFRVERRKSFKVVGGGPWTFQSTIFLRP
jgi:hypothetical protein